MPNVLATLRSSNSRKTSIGTTKLVDVLHRYCILTERYFRIGLCVRRFAARNSKGADLLGGANVNFRPLNYTPFALPTCG